MGYFSDLLEELEKVNKDHINKDCNFLGIWCRILSLGERCYQAITCRPATEPWKKCKSKNEFCQELKRFGFDKLFEYELVGKSMRFPWRGNRIDVQAIDDSFFEIINKFKPESAYEADYCLYLIGLLDYALSDYLYNINESIDELYIKFAKSNLVPIPSYPRRYWESRFEADELSRHVLNYTYHDGLSTFINTEIPVRVFRSITKLSKNSDINKLKILFVQPNYRFIKEECKQHPDKWHLKHDDLLTTSLLGFFEEFYRSYDNSDFDFAILPEYTMSETLRSAIQNKWNDSWRFKGKLIAGSGHVRLSTGNTSHPCCNNANRSALVFRNGQASEGPRIAHLKRNPYESECLAIQGGCEVHPFVLVDTDWGRISILICRDFIQESDGIRSTLINSRIDHLFIPVFNPGVGETFESYGKTAGKYLVAVYMVDGNKPDKPFQVYTPFLLSRVLADDVKENEKDPIAIQRKLVEFRDKEKGKWRQEISEQLKVDKITFFPSCPEVSYCLVSF